LLESALSRIPAPASSDPLNSIGSHPAAVLGIIERLAGAASLVLTSD